MKAGPIILVEDDAEDKVFFEETLRELNFPNKLIWFTNTIDALQYLRTTSDQPFIIFSDVNLPRQSGIEFKREIDLNPALRKKSIPFIFYSTSVDQRAVNEAYTQMTVQGFFKKANGYEEMKQTIKLILNYWQVCTHPNTI